MKKETKRGRPRSNKTRIAILQAASDLLKVQPLPSITMDQIAERAGVSKATLYRWWTNKIDLLVDAFVEDRSARQRAKGGESSFQVLMDGLRDLFALFTGPEGRIIADIIGHGRDNPIAVELFRERFLEPRRAIARELMECAKAADELRADLNVEVALDMIFAPLYYRLLVQHLPLEESLCDNLQVIVGKGFK